MKETGDVIQWNDLLHIQFHLSRTGMLSGCQLGVTGLIQLILEAGGKIHNSINPLSHS